MFDAGTGPPIVVVPGVHGRWEWARPAMERLARRCRAISYTLCGDFGSRRRFDPALGFDNFVHQIDDVLDGAGLERAAICGVSFGGFIALHYAAERPERVTALVLASAPGPEWRPSAQQARWLSRPWWSAPGFVLTSPMRIWPEVRAAIPGTARRLGFLVRQGVRCLAAPLVPPLLTRRVRCASSIDFRRDAAAVRAPTLVLSGEEPLDRVVPVRSTRTYASLIRNASYVVLTGTGHLGPYTQPDRFAEIVSGFVHAHSR